MMRSRHPMGHAQKRALQGTNEISGLGLRPLRPLPYTPVLFLARCAATFVAYPAQKRGPREARGPRKFALDRSLWETPASIAARCRPVATENSNASKSLEFWDGPP